MLYCLPSGVDSNIAEERSDGIDPVKPNMHTNFYDILELILELIHYCNQIPDKSNLKEVRFIRFRYQILD